MSTPSLLSRSDTQSAYGWRSLRPLWPERATTFILCSFGLVGALFLGYLVFFEYNIAEWNPWGTPFNLLATGLLTFLFFSLLHLLSRRFWFSITIAMALVLFLAAWSDIKFRMNGFSLTVVDLMILDPAAISFALNQPDFRWHFVGAGVLFMLMTALFIAERPSGWGIWARLARSIAALILLIGTLFFAFPGGARQAMQIGNAYHVTVFTKSLLAVVDYFRHDGIVEKLPPQADAPAVGATECTVPPGTRLPHIITIIDEAGVDTNRIAAVTPDPVLKDHFKSYDGSLRSLRVETFGGGTWLTETSVLTGLSTRTFGPFSPIATRLVADRVRLALPEWLGQCGYETRSIYPAGGRFMSARRMHDGLKVSRFEDWFDLKAKDPSLSDALQLRDNVYYRYTLDRIAANSSKPSFTFLWLTSNHTPWDEQLSPETKVDGVPPQRTPAIAEYVRRQRLAKIDLDALKTELARRFPEQSFLIIRFGDHAPFIAGSMFDPDLPEQAVWNKIDAFDPQYFTGYLALDTINYQPVKPIPPFPVMSASYIGMAMLQMIGLPLNPVGQYQASIVERCNGLLVDCDGGKAVRQFNGWLQKNGITIGL
jgi:hypothetical protein